MKEGGRGKTERGMRDGYQESKVENASARDPDLPSANVRAWVISEGIFTQCYARPGDVHARPGNKHAQAGRCAGANQELQTHKLGTETTMTKQ